MLLCNDDDDDDDDDRIATKGFTADICYTSSLMGSLKYIFSILLFREMTSVNIDPVSGNGCIAIFALNYADQISAKSVQRVYAGLVTRRYT